jgi:hypothetical protein
VFNLRAVDFGEFIVSACIGLFFFILAWRSPTVLLAAFLEGHLDIDYNAFCAAVFGDCP